MRIYLDYTTSPGCKHSSLAHVHFVGIDRPRPDTLSAFTAAHKSSQVQQPITMAQSTTWEAGRYDYKIIATRVVLA